MSDIEQAKKVLKDKGYYVDRLFHEDDVKELGFKFTDYQSYNVLDKVFNNQVVDEIIWDTIEFVAREEVSDE
jgi:hypothetical protein|tara:strand:+ start:547 stop:762 length:216 start_codon:yes stop_codon:yes gene_type:complete